MIPEGSNKYFIVFFLFRNRLLYYNRNIFYKGES